LRRSVSCYTSFEDFSAHVVLREKEKERKGERKKRKLR
jgi:hypothetical protein